MEEQCWPQTVPSLQNMHMHSPHRPYPEFVAHRNYKDFFSRGAQGLQLSPVEKGKPRPRKAQSLAQSQHREEAGTSITTSDRVISSQL